MLTMGLIEPTRNACLTTASRERCNYMPIQHSCVMALALCLQLVSFVEVSRAQHVSDSDCQRPAPVLGIDPELRLQVETTSTVRSAGDEQVDVVEISLVLRFTNMGPSRVLLRQDASVVGRIIVRPKSTSIDALDLRPLVVSGKTWTPSRRPGKDILRIAPQESVELTANMTVLVGKRSSERIVGAVRPGEYEAEVEIWTWHSTSVDPSLLRQRWASYGILCYKPVTSVPFAITL